MRRAGQVSRKEEMRNAYRICQKSPRDDDCLGTWWIVRYLKSNFEISLHKSFNKEDCTPCHNNLTYETY